MNKTYIILAFIILFSCNKKENDFSEKSKKQDSLIYYLNKLNIEKLNQKQRLHYINRAYSLIIASSNSSKNRDSLFSISFKLYGEKNWNLFNKFSQALLKKSLETNDSINLVKAYRYRAGYYKNTQVYDSSYYYYLRAEKIYLKFNDRLNYANILLNKGIVQYNIGDYLGSQLSLSKAYYIFKNSNEKDKLYGTLNQLGLVCNELKEYDESADYHKKALETVRLNNLQNNELLESICYNNLGYLFLKKQDFSVAIKNFKLALNNKKIIQDDPELYSTLIDNTAYCKTKLNSFEGLPKLFFEALEVRKKLDNINDVIGSYIHLSEYYQARGNSLEAIKYSKEALKVAKSSKIPLNIIFALKQASNVDKENASKYTDDYIRISDSLQLAERKNIDRFARIELETDEIRQERDDFEEKSQNNLYYLLGTVSFFIVLLTIRTQRTKARVRAMKHAQQIANEEIYKLIISQQGKLQEGRELEKSRIAKDLHDGVLGRLFGLRLNLDGLNNRTEAEAVAMRLNYINELKLIEQDIREISHELSREKEALINNFVSILNNLIDDQSMVNKAVIKIKIGKNIDWDKFSNLVKINLYRILQECLQNINKYADANNIKIDIINDKKKNLVMKIVDDGKGFNVDKKSYGIGIKNMISRTNECKGTLDIKSEINNGTKITLTIPFEN